MNRETPLIQVLKDRVKEADRPLGFLKDQHVKWVVGFTYLFFNTRTCDIDIDFNKRVLHVTPYKGPKGVKIQIDRLRWCVHSVVLWYKKHERDIMPFLELPEWKVKFHRVRPDSKDLLPIEEVRK